MFCSVTEVKNAINFPATGAPVDDSVITTFILDAEDEIEHIYKTRFGNIEDSGTATAGGASSLTDSTKTWTVDGYAGYVLWIYSGTGVGQYREILSNTATAITVSDAFDTTPDITSKYRITKLGYKSQTVDGTGTDTHFAEFQPLIKLNALSIDSTTITPSYVYQYESGKLVLSQDAEDSSFSAVYPQLISLKYIFGVYPMPRVIKRLCICLAGMRTLSAQISGTYDDFTTISLPHLSGSKGEPYMNIREGLAKLQEEAKRIIENYRPFIVIG